MVPTIGDIYRFVFAKNLLDFLLDHNPNLNTWLSLNYILIDPQAYAKVSYFTKGFSEDKELSNV